nr:transketolase C-terminal domain-containing protein [uncultured Oscillibacter sp.]
MGRMYLNRSIAAAVSEEMARDESVILLGEDIINNGGGLSSYLGVPPKFPDRCLDMPIAEAGFSYFGVGAAVAGMRPIVDMMFSDFASICADAVSNGAAKVAFMTQAACSCPITFIMANGGRGTYGSFGSGCHHSQCTESWFQNVPGLKIVAPYYPADVKGLLKASIRDNDPVVFMFHEGSTGKSGMVPEGEHVIPLTNAANILREGRDVTIVAIQSMVPIAVEAAERLAEQGIDAEVIDPRVLIPLDIDKLQRSVEKTGRLVVVQEAPRRGAFGGEIVSEIVERMEGRPVRVKRLGSKNAPIGNGCVEYFLVPKVEDVVAAAQAVCGSQRSPSL